MRARIIILIIIILSTLGLSSTPYSIVTAQDGDDTVTRTIVFPIDAFLRGDPDVMADLLSHGLSVEDIALMRRYYEQSETRGPVVPNYSVIRLYCGYGQPAVTWGEVGSGPFEIVWSLVHGSESSYLYCDCARCGFQEILGPVSWTAINSVGVYATGGVYAHYAACY